MRLVRRYDQDEREIDGAVHWNTICPTLLRACGDKGVRFFSEKDWLQHVYEGGSGTVIIPKFFNVHSCNSRTHW